MTSEQRFTSEPTDAGRHRVLRSEQRFPAEAIDPARVGEFIADAFASLDIARWLVPDPVERRRILAAQFAMLAQHANSHGHIDVAFVPNGQWTGVAVWADRTDEDPGAPDGYEERLAEIAGAHLSALQTLDMAFKEHHPHRVPHLHLMFLAVAPHHQGDGIGTRLLEIGLGRADQAGVAVYLEASSDRARRLYQRHGFTPRAPIALPAGPELYPMLRTAH